MRSDQLEDIRRSKKASRRGKMAHVTKILKWLNSLFTHDASRREIEGMVISLNEAMAGFKVYHDEYVATLIDVKQLTLPLAN